MRTGLPQCRQRTPRKDCVGESTDMENTPLEVQTGCEALAGYRKAPRNVHPKIKRWVVEKSDASRQEQSDNKYLFLFDIKTLQRGALTGGRRLPHFPESGPRRFEKLEPPNRAPKK